ncbi:MAG TPA: hypothetical protein VGH14_12980 [Solirubrobacterales bacterium]
MELRSTVFGLDVVADRPLAYLAGASAEPTGLRFELGLDTRRRGVAWEGAAERISDERDARGEVVFQIEAGRQGYRITGPEYGQTVLDAAGSRGRGRLDGAAPERWQRMLVAQALPFAAVLRGLEVFHAAGATVGGRAVLLTGRSGAGKSSLALALRRRGAGLLADDVVAVDRRGDELIAHPGAPVAAVDAAEAARLGPAQVDGDGPVLGANGRETMVAVAPLAAAAPLGAVFVLEREAAAEEPRFEPVEDPRLLLASTFNLVLRDPRRLGRLLDLCARVSRTRCERLVFGSTATPEDLATLVEARVAKR